LMRRQTSQMACSIELEFHKNQLTPKNVGNVDLCRTSTGIV
jgi:hypothetical protein